MEYLIGKVVFLDKNYLILENRLQQGICIHINERHNYRQDQEYKIFIHEEIKIEKTSISIKKYGFPNLQSLLLFQFLLEIKGIGPKIAFLILETSSSELLKAISQNNLLPLMHLPYIKKYASEIISLSKAPKYKKLFHFLASDTNKEREEKYHSLLKIFQEIETDPEKTKAILSSIDISSKSEGEIVREVMSKLNDHQ